LEFVPYLEASVGVHLLSHTRINEERQFSTAFQFGEFLALASRSGSLASTTSVCACNTFPMGDPETK